MRIAILLTSLACAGAFAPMMPSRTVISSPSTKLNLMPPEEVDALLTHANECAEGECTLDEVDELITVLKDQQSQLYRRVEELKTMIKELEGINEGDERNVDEVRETVRAIFRVFQLGDKASGNDYPALSKPTGWSGEVGDGPTDAYKSLNPKPWKPKAGEK